MDVDFQFISDGLLLGSGRTLECSPDVNYPELAQTSQIQGKILHKALLTLDMSHRF